MNVVSAIVVLISNILMTTVEMIDISIHKTTAEKGNLQWRRQMQGRWERVLWLGHSGVV
jgi:hypothetical protein